MFVCAVSVLLTQVFALIKIYFFLQEYNLAVRLFKSIIKLEPQRKLSILSAIGRIYLQVSDCCLVIIEVFFKVESEMPDMFQFWEEWKARCCFLVCLFVVIDVVFCHVNPPQANVPLYLNALNNDTADITEYRKTLQWRGTLTFIVFILLSEQIIGNFAGFSQGFYFFRHLKS